MSGESMSDAEQCLASLHHYLPVVRGHLSPAWDLVRCWRRLEPPSRTPPWSRQLMRAISSLLLSYGKPTYGLAIMVGWDCALRTGEMLSIKAIDCIFLRNALHLHLGCTKTSYKDNRVDVVPVQDEKVIKLLRQWKLTVSDDTLLVDSCDAFRKLVKRAMVDLGVDGMNLALYGIRRGAATAIFEETNSYDAVQEKGRWLCQKSATIYINTCLRVRM